MFFCKMQEKYFVKYDYDFSEIFFLKSTQFYIYFEISKKNFLPKLLKL